MTTGLVGSEMCIRDRPCPVRGLWWVVLPVRQLCPLWDTTLMHITISALPLARLDCIGFSLQSCHLPEFIALVSVYNADTCQTLLHRFHLTAVPLARLYCIVVSLQPCHWPDFISLDAVYSPATCQTLLQWFQFTAVPLVRFYCSGSRLQPYHWSDFISLFSVGSHDACQTLFHGFSLRPDACQTLFHWFQRAVLPLARFDLSRFSLQPAYICTEIYDSESYHVWLCPSGP